MQILSKKQTRRLFKKIPKMATKLDVFWSPDLSCDFLPAKEHRAAGFPLFIVLICCSIVRNF